MMNNIGQNIFFHFLVKRMKLYFTYNPMEIKYKVHHNLYVVRVPVNATINHSGPLKLERSF